MRLGKGLDVGGSLRLCDNFHIQHRTRQQIPPGSGEHSEKAEWQCIDMTSCLSAHFDPFWFTSVSSQNNDRFQAPKAVHFSLRTRQNKQATAMPDCAKYASLTSMRLVHFLYAACACMPYWSTADVPVKLSPRAGRP